MPVRKLISLAALALVACLSALPASAASAAPSCGKGKIKKSTGGYWTCSFGEDFNGTSLNRSAWQPMTTATMGLSHAGECYVDDPSHISVGNGQLTLTATKQSSPANCGWFQTPYQSGMVFTNFAQTYGRFEARVRFPKGHGFASGWWMWPKNMTYGEKSGEIDIAEHFGAYPDYVNPFVHIRDSSRGELGKTAYCSVADPSGQFHTYTVEWLPLKGFRFIYDGVTCMTMSSWDPGSPLTFPQPFDQPFFMALTLSLGYGENSVTDSTPFPGKMNVDYVRAWK
jgi:beta-glucanase (GH16 family)